ncbi:MAG: M14 family zinc carboxypeptidase [Actinomycetota bacterium]
MKTTFGWPARRPRQPRNYGGKRLRQSALCAALMVGLTAPVGGWAAPSSDDPAGPAGNIKLFRVTASTEAEVARLVNGGYDLIEHREGKNYFILGTVATGKELRGAGYQVQVEEVLRDADDDTTLSTGRITTSSPGVYPTFYGGYRTVGAHEQHVTDIAANHPDLAQVIDYGDSWRKQQGLGGWDLRALCLTKQQPGDCALAPGTKPRTIVMAAIHPRELSTSEMAWRAVDYLVGNYNTLPEITTLLDHQEVWVIPVANPDGLEIVESGGNTPYLQRKNADTTNGAGCASPPTSSNQAGVDLNRNATFKWGGTGSSVNVCDQTYRGTTAASEPEQQALETLFSQLFADTRGAADTDAAATTTTGALLSLHSYSNLTLLPWGWTTNASPNNAALRALAFRMSYYNGYKTGTGPEILYSTTGTTDDHLYGTLGVPGFTVEIGPASGTCGGFTPAFSCQDTFWPLIRDSILSLAKNSRAPYTQTAGPNTTSAAATVSGTTVTISGTANDNAYGNASGSIGRPTTQNINAGRYYLDTPPWAGSTATSMTATDGSFNAKSEGIRATRSITGLSPGRHSVYVQGRDTSGTWGPVTTAWFTVP